jgi:chromate transporter
VPAAIAFATAARFWLVLGWINFGGPAGQIAILHRELVERRGWLDERRFTHALNYCMLLPGPEAMQLATYIGWRLHGTRGALVAATFLPSFFFILLVAPCIERLRGVPWLDAALTAITAAVVVGVILNLGVVFGSAVLFPRGDWNVFALIVAIVAALVLGRGINVAWIALVGGVAGLVAHLLGWITP